VSPVQVRVSPSRKGPQNPVQERWLSWLPCFTACGLVCGELVLEVVVDVDAAHSRRRFGVEHAELAPGEVDVLAD
jgi:hypothetical protein